MKTLTKLVCNLTKLAAITLISASSAGAAVLWDVQTPSAPGVWAELVKEGLVSDAAGNTFSAGYRNGNTAAGADAVIYKRNAAGVLLATWAYHPVAGDSYWCTGIGYDSTANILVVSGTRFIAATKTYEWWANRIDPVTLTTAGLPVLLRWNGGVGWAYTPASLITAGAPDAFTTGGRIVISGGYAYASGCTNRSLVIQKLALNTGVPAGWAAAAPQAAGVRFIGASGCAMHRMPGSTGGFYSNMPQSFVEVQGANVLVAGSLDFGAGGRMDAVVQSYTQAAGVVNWGRAFNNVGQDDLLKAIAVGTNGVYLTGDTLGGASSGFLQGYTLAGGAIVGVPNFGPLTSNANDVETLNVAGVDHIYIAGHQPAGGVIAHQEYNGVGVVVSGAWASVAYGVLPSDQPNDLAIGNAGGFVNYVYGTGSLYDGGVLMQRATEISVTPAGLTAFNLGIAQPIASGTAALFNSAALTIFTHGNAISGAGNALIEHARFTP